MRGDGADYAFDEASVAKLTQDVGSVIDQFGGLGCATGSMMRKGFSGLAMRGWKPGTPDGQQISRHEWNEFMAAVMAMLAELSGIASLTAEGAAARFSALEWTPRGKPRDGVETSWERNGIRGWTQTFGGGAVIVSFTVWIRDVDESGYFDDLDAVYEQGKQALASFLPEIEESALMRPPRRSRADGGGQG